MEVETKLVCSGILLDREIAFKKVKPLSHSCTLEVETKLVCNGILSKGRLASKKVRPISYSSNEGIWEEASLQRYMSDRETAFKIGIKSIVYVHI